MSFQYYSKPLEELQSIARVIHNNFTELVGCKYDSCLWSPATGYHICEALTLNGTQCTNVGDDYIEVENYLTYKFSSSVNTEAKNIWLRVLNFDKELLDSSYVTSLKIAGNLPTKNKLEICVDQSLEYDCPIFEVCQNNNQILYSEECRRLYLIILSCFSIQYNLYDFAMGHQDTINSDAINDSVLDSIIQNIEYEKYKLSQMSTTALYENSPERIQEQLNLLMKNCRQVEAYVLPYIR